MQALIEGLALAAFGLIRNMATDPLGRAINAYVMQDEARHVMFGRLALRDFYADLSTAERDGREQFAVDALYLMRDRFLIGYADTDLDAVIADDEAIAEDFDRRHRAAVDAAISTDSV